MITNNILLFNNKKTALMTLSLVAFSMSFFSVKMLALSMLLLAVTVFIEFSRVGGVAIDRKFSLFLSVLFVFIFGFSILRGIYLNYLIKVSFLIFYCILFFGVVLNSGRNFFKEVLFYYIVIHSGVFFVQFIFSNLFGYYIDFDSYVRDSETYSLHESKALDFIWLRSRGGGFFSEPSFFAMAVVPAVVSYVLLLRKLTVVTYFALSSILLSFSIAAIVITFAVMCGFYIFRVVPRGKALYVVVLSSLLWPSLYQFYDLRVNEAVDYDPLESREVIFYELTSRDMSAALIGVGFLWDENNIPSNNRLVGYEVRDSSFYPYLLFCSGYLGFLLFFALLFVMYGRWYLLLYFMFVLFLFKFHVVTSMFWTLLMFLQLNSRFREDRNDSPHR